MHAALPLKAPQMDEQGPGRLFVREIESANLVV
jgi:hypothetical protein